jgi:hypothetical protein
MILSQMSNFGLRIELRITICKDETLLRRNFNSEEKIKSPLTKLIYKNSNYN